MAVRWNRSLSLAWTILREWLWTGWVETSTGLIPAPTVLKWPVWMASTDKCWSAKTWITLALLLWILPMGRNTSFKICPALTPLATVSPLNSLHMTLTMLHAHCLVFTHPLVFWLTVGFLHFCSPVEVC